MGFFLQDEKATDKVVDVRSNRRHRVLQTLCFRYAIFILILVLVTFLSSCKKEGSTNKQQDESTDIVHGDDSKTLKRDKGARFTRNHAEAGVDSDENGKYNVLSVKAEIEVVTDGNYAIYGFLLFEGKRITSRPFATASALSYSYLSSGPAIQTITMNFSGEDIYKSGKSGRYTIDLKLIDDKSGDCIDTALFETRKFSYEEFGEFQR